MTYPSFTSGDILTAADMNAVGLWLVKTKTVLTNELSVTVTGAFSSTYDNYLITLEGGTISLSGSIGIQLGASATGYYGFLSYGNATTNVVQGAGRNNAIILNWVGGGIGGQRAHVHVQVFGPNKAAYTKFLNGAYQSDNNYGTMQGEHRVATAYTDFTIWPDSGTLTGGTIRVYGYRN